ncbi:MAG TPA: DUF1700 domain-containing protein [Thermoanaerobaculia bacterium]
MNTSHSERLQTRIDAYLMRLRRSLGELPPDEVADILREIRGHILERAEASGDMSEERLVAILKTLGRPEDIAPLYQAEALMARARTSYSPTLLLRSALRWGMLSVWGIAIFLAGLFGYGISLALFLSGFGKMIAPDKVGAWVTPGGFSIGAMNNPAAHEVLGWWLVPVGLAVGAIGLVATTWVLRWALGFAKLRRAIPAS